jgi:hypothetical protein
MLSSNRNRFDSRRERLATTVPGPSVGPLLPAIQRVPGAVFSGINRLEREAEHHRLLPRLKMPGVVACPKHLFIAWC